MRKYVATAALAATGTVGDSPLFLMDYALRFLRVAVLLSIWRLIFAGRGPVGGMVLGAVLTYTLVAKVFAEQLYVRTELANALWDGSIVMRFLQPMALVGQFAAQAAGRWAFDFAFFSLPLLLLAPLLGVDPRPADPPAALWFLLSLALAVAGGLALEFIFAALIVASGVGVWAIEYLRNGLTTLLSGALLPLALLPWHLGAVFTWLPFAATASAPLRLYTATGDPRLLLPLQAFWCVVLWLLAGALWRAYREQVVGHGG